MLTSISLPGVGNHGISVKGVTRVSDWNGTFLRKHVTTITFNDLKDMDKDDWEVLDFPKLTDPALNSLIARIMCGGTTGFYQVDIDMHKSHGGKPRYFYPGTREGGEPNPNFKGGTGSKKSTKADGKTEREFRRRYSNLDGRPEPELRDQLKQRGFPIARIRTWPKWAIVITIIALNRREEGFSCD